MTQSWRYFPFARIHTFHDGDTCEVEVDSGFGASHRVAVRVYGISAPEVHGEEKELGARALTRVRIYESLPCELWTWKQSFARYVGRMVLTSGAELAGADVARRIIGFGVARAWDGVTARPDPKLVTINDDLAEYDRILARDFKP